jgi:methylglutaconyl-CoA hydratase
MSVLLVEPGPVTTIRLNRPDVRNALDEALIDALAGWAGSVPQDGTIRAVVLRGNGSVFCAGADLAWMRRVAAHTHEENLNDARRAARMFHALDTLPVPLVAGVQGAALGGGAGLVAVCDIVIAAENAVLGFPETTLGIVPATISPYIVRKIGLSAARRFCLSGARFPAAEACRIGLVHEIVPEADLDAALERRVAEFARAAPSAIAATKRLLAAVDGRAPDDVLSLTADALASQRGSAEGQEGIRAFLEKRLPAWAPSDREAPRTAPRRSPPKRRRR